MLLRRLIVGNLHTNCYLVAAGKGGQGVIIDPGGSLERITEASEEEGLSVKYIINTHGHPDHVAADSALARLTGATIAIHPLDLAWNPLDSRESPSTVSSGQSNCSVLKLSDAMILEVGDLELKVIHTPGHTLGSVCIYLDGILFTGDLLFQGSVGRTDFPGGSSADLMRSLREKIVVLPPSTRVLPGHGEETTLEEELKHNPFLQGFS